jgi:predicted AAA+ superfamily ATPase
MTKRKVNKLEAFRPSSKSRVIIDALQGEFKKTHIYNTLIERFGRQLAFESLSESDYYNLIQELEELK